MFDHINLMRLIVELTLGPVVLWLTLSMVGLAIYRRIHKSK